jgi:hypothetical protein
LTAFGTDAVQAAALVPAEVELILDNDMPFDNKLAEDGIVDVRLQESGGEAALNSSGVANSSSENSDSARPAVVAILSVAAGTVLAAAVIRKLFKRGGATAAVGKYDSDAGSEGGTLNNTA